MTVDDLIAEGRAALGSGRWADARMAYEAALTLEPDPRALDGLGEAMWWLGEPHRSNELREQAYARLRRAGDRAPALLAALGIAVTYESNFGNGPAANGWVARASRLLTGDDDPLAPSVWATRAYVTADLRAAMRLYERALAAARAAGDLDVELTCLSGLGERLVMSGEVGAGLALIDEAMAGTLGGECARLDTVVFTSCDMLVACDLAHDLERATRWCQVADRFIRTYGCPFLSARCRTIYGGLLVATGRWVEGERELAAAIGMSEGAGPAVVADAYARLADLRLRQGRVEEASSLLRGHEDHLRAQVTAAAVRLASGDSTGAVTLVQRRLSQIADGHLGAGAALALLVRASLALGDIDGAGHAARRLARLADDGDSAFVHALRATAEGHVAVELGDADGAEEWWETALRLFVSLGMPQDVARTRLDLARLHASRRPEVAVGEAEAALAAFERIGATIDADTTAALLRSLGVRPPPGRRAAGDLTQRERQVLRLVGLGLSNPEIAARLHISRKTAAHHVSRVLGKLGVRNRTEAVTHLRSTLE